MLNLALYRPIRPLKALPWLDHASPRVVVDLGVYGDLGVSVVSCSTGVEIVDTNDPLTSNSMPVTI